MSISSLAVVLRTLSLSQLHYIIIYMSSGKIIIIILLQNEIESNENGKASQHNFSM